MVCVINRTSVKQFTQLKMIVDNMLFSKVFSKIIGPPTHFLQIGHFGYISKGVCDIIVLKQLSCSL
jgi:hypothetical protein